MSCPYSSQNTSTTTTSEALHITKEKCPAFKDGSCPFRGANSSDELKAKLRSIPPSHEKDIVIKTNFKLALEHMHTVGVDVMSQQHNGSRGETKKYLLEGGCPFKDGGEFRDAMETFSLSAIMSQMVDEQESAVLLPKNVDQRQEEESTSAATGTISTSPKQASSLSLSSTLKTGTAKSHRAAENVHFVRNFIKGKIERQLYSHLVSSLFMVYSILESELDKHAPSHFPTLHHPQALQRTSSLKADLEFFNKNGNLTPSTPSPATMDYMNRIQEIAATQPLLLLAHGYTRYLGDLSGGRVLQRVAKKAMGLSDKEGLSFYEFDHIPNPKSFKNEYRKALDELNLTEKEVSMLVGEANVAFVLNMRLFEELDVLAKVQGAKVRPLDQALMYARMDQEEDTVASAKGSDKCPFANINSNKQAEHDTTETHHKIKKGTCPWPFILMHDPKKGAKAIQTWIVIGISMALSFGNYHWTKAFTIFFSTMILWYCFVNDKHTNNVTVNVDAKKTCPWPFILFHDPKKGMQCFQTWICIGLALTLVYNKIVASH